MKRIFLPLMVVLLFACNGKKKDAEKTETPDTTKTTQVTEKPKGFVSVNGTHFEIDGKPYYYLGTNFWYGLNLGSKGAGGNRERLIRELDRLVKIGVRNLRVVAGSEGPDTEPWRMVPAMQTAPGQYNMEVVDGLDFLLDEMRKRDMKAIMCLNDFWPWSGGMGQYLVWAGAADSIPYPPPHPGGSWDDYPKFTAQFYSNPKAVEMFNKHIEFVVNRKNPYSNIEYKNDPTIMAWELANEPRGVNNLDAFAKWIDETAGLIKKLDPHHLVTTGSEGNTSNSKSSGTDLEKDHSSKSIDYATMHIWVQNWGWYDPAKAKATYPVAVDSAMKYFERHAAAARKLNKPLVLEEFGISRDLNNHAANTPTTVRDKYYERMFEEVYRRSIEPNSLLSGVNFWAWGGEGRPKKPMGFWKAGDDFIGDPPHEAQGWYSVFDNDSSTIKVMDSVGVK
jgi:mannan endo-1,4-beta-mannosidase